MFPLAVSTKVGLNLPYSVDFTQLPNGLLPGRFVGSTWSILSGSAINSPTLGAEMLTDPGLEANYTAGKCDSLNKSGSPVLVQSADSHSGSKAQQFTAIAAGNYVYWPAVAGVSGTWYQFSAWGKRTTGSAGITNVDAYQANSLPSSQEDNQIVSANYLQRFVSWISCSTDLMYCSPAKCLNTSFDTVIVDDGSCKPITYSSLFSLLPSTVANVVVKAIPAFSATEGTLFGLVLRADAQSNPTNCIFVIAHVYSSDPTIVSISVVKKVGSTYTSVLAETIKNIASNAWLEARASGNIVSIWYNNAQVGGNLTISDAQLVSNTYHGMFSSGGNSLNRFFLGDS